ncbi:MAG: AAA family ATPase [Desulfovibrio sp.]|jgi:DNA repair protein RecN (Recombination protein N)|nr:AAA family ATPase [Desulfovibrio sp.]
MLEYLGIHNLALIEDMELEFSPGLNVLTGETGAGKSFVMKAIGFLLGDRLGQDMVRPGADRAQVEALFILNENELILRRELSSQTGRARLYINDNLKSQEALRELRDQLITHTSQHAQHALLKMSFQAALIEDVIADSPQALERDALSKALAENFSRREDLLKKQAELAARRDLLEMQQEEIDKTAPEEGEEERLEELRREIRNSAQLSKNFEEALQVLHGENSPGLLDLLAKFEKLLHKICACVPEFVEAANEVSNLAGQLRDLSGRLLSPRPGATTADIDKIEERLFTLAQLKRKLRKTFPEILALRRENAANLSFLDACALDISRLSKEGESISGRLKSVIREIIPLRRKVAQEFAKGLTNELVDLGFSADLAVIPEFLAHEIRPGIFDENTRFLWAPNPGQAPQPLDRIASGGELSRFLLALVCMRPALTDATYIFDEIDAGVGGLVLNKLAQKLRTLAEKRQILLITHWPLLAARADKHFRVTKEVRNQQTYTLCAHINADERLTELSRMAGGGEEGEAFARSLRP